MKSLKFTLLAVLVAGGLATPALAVDTSIYHSTISRNEQVTILTNRGESNLSVKELQNFAQVTNADPNVRTLRLLSQKTRRWSITRASLPSIPRWHTSWSKYPGADEDVRAHPGNFVEPTNASAWNRQSTESGVR